MVPSLESVARAPERRAPRHGGRVYPCPRAAGPVMMLLKDDASIDPVCGAMSQGVEATELRCVRVDRLVSLDDITEDI